MCVLYLLCCLKVLFNQVLHPQPLHRSAFHHLIVIHVYLIWKTTMWFLHQYSTPAAHPQWHIWADLWCLPSSHASSRSEWCLWGLPLGPQISGWSEMCWTSQSRRCSPPVENQKGYAYVHLLIHHFGWGGKHEQLTLRRMRGFSGVSGHPSRSLSASSNISATYRIRGRAFEVDKEQRRYFLSGSYASLKPNLCVTEVLHFLHDLRCFWREGVFIISQHNVLYEELSHSL